MKLKTQRALLGDIYLRYDVIIINNYRRCDICESVAKAEQIDEWHHLFHSRGSAKTTLISLIKCLQLKKYEMLANSRTFFLAIKPINLINSRHDSWIASIWYHVIQWPRKKWENNRLFAMWFFFMTILSLLIFRNNIYVCRMPKISVDDT